MRKSSATRFREPQRSGQSFIVTIAEDSLPPEHPARLLWTTLGEFDLTGFAADAKAVVGRPGRAVYSPRMMLTLWGFALYEGVVHAREIVRRLDRDLPYRWIVGDVDVQRSAVSAFLADHRGALVDLLADVLAARMDAQLLFLPTHRLAQDGTRVRADAASASFRTAAGLATYRAQATLHLKAVLAQLDEPALAPREQAARERGAMAVVDRIRAATRALAEVAAQRARHRSSDAPPTASTTDPDARIMKFASGAFAPGYNLQFATAGDPRGGPLTIVGVQTTNRGTDQDSVFPMRDPIAVQTGCVPLELLVDPDHVSLADVRRAAREHLALISRVPKRWRPDGRRQDATTRAWMAQMQTPAARDAYRARKVLAERPNAILKTWMGLDRLPVRGLDRVHNLALLVAIMVNLHEHRAHWLN